MRNKKPYGRVIRSMRVSCDIDHSNLVRFDLYRHEFSYIGIEQWILEDTFYVPMSVVKSFFILKRRCFFKLTRRAKLRLREMNEELSKEDIGLNNLFS